MARHAQGGDTAHMSACPRRGEQVSDLHVQNARAELQGHRLVKGDAGRWLELRDDTIADAERAGFAVCGAELGAFGGDICRALER